MRTMNSWKSKYTVLCIVLGISILSLAGVQAAGGATDMKRLLTTMLTNYSSGVMPVNNRSSPLNVQLGINIMAVVYLDTRNQILHLRGFVRATWTDILLVWDPLQYGNISYVILPQRDIWKPDITMTNSLHENIYVGSEETRVYVDHKGLVMWQPAFTSDFKCQVDVTKYPMDENICAVMLNSWMHDNTYVKLSMLDPHTVLEKTVFNGQFIIEVVEPMTKVDVYDGLEYDFLYFRIRLHRRPSYTFLSMLLPMFLIGLLNIVSFLIPYDNSEKVSLSLNVLLATAVYIGVVHDDLPDRSDKISTVAMYVVFLLVFSFLGVLGNTLVLLLHQHDSPRETSGPNDHDEDTRSTSARYNDVCSSNSSDSSPKYLSHSKALQNALEVDYDLKTPNHLDQVHSLVPRVVRPNVRARDRVTRAAQLNKALLIASMLGLFGCTTVVLLLVTS